MQSPKPVYDANTSGGKSLGNLPEWDLSDLYPATDSLALKTDMDWLETECVDFAKTTKASWRALMHPDF